MTLTTFVFPKLRTLKTWLDKCLKSPVLEDPSTSSMVNMSKHCWNLHHTTFIIFIDHYEENLVGKSLSYWNAKSREYLLTSSLPMESILFFIGTISRYQFRSNYLRKKKTFSEFFGAFVKFRLNFEVFESEKTLIDFVFSKLESPKT